MLDHAAWIFALLLDWIAKGFVILGLAFLADWLFRRASASLRHLLWQVGLASVMLLPVVSGMLPNLDVSLFHLNLLVAGAGSQGGSGQVGSEVGSGWSTSEILLGVYIAGALLVFAWQLIGRAYVYRLRKRAGEIPDGQLTRELQRLKASLGIRNPVGLLSSDLISIPFSTGFFHPVIVLPQATSSWPAPVMESVLIHELAHIKRKDILTRIAAQISCCIHWINPLAWYGLGRIIVEQEIACDNLVLGTGTKASDYARNLLALSDMRRGRMDFALTALGRRAELRSRLLEILKPTRNRAPMRIGGSLVFLLLTVGLLLSVSAVNIWDASDAGMTPEPQDLVRLDYRKPAPPQTAGSPQPSYSSVKVLPDLEEVKAGLSKKIQEMKEKGVAPEEIAKFTMAAKAKIEDLRLQRMKQADEKRKQMELTKSQERKKLK